MQRKYLDCDIGVEDDDLSLFRTLAVVHGTPLHLVIEAAINIGADSLRSGRVRLAVRPEDRH